MKQKIVIAGGSGFLGNCLVKNFKSEGAEIIILTRSESRVADGVSYIQWDAKTPGDWTNALEGADVVINLVGKSVNCRYNEKNKKEIIESRENATRVLGMAIKKAVNSPKLWINAGSAAIFGDSGNGFKYENSKIGEGFSPEVCKRWEQAFNEIGTPNTRKIFLRIGMVFQPGEGVLKPFMNMAKFGLGGPIGSGEQYITWIHHEDFVNLIHWLIDRESINGVVHAASPAPVTNKEFMKTLRTACHMPIGLPNPSPLIKLGAMLIGTEPELVLSGRRVVSKVLEENKFKFKYPKMQDAMKELTQQPAEAK